nr:MAG TPA: hypothetical protein [Caudoviricetes sp.]DAL71970.1 MAG TPA: hypothetical protein [Caudoviricetes sp.]
MQKPLKTLGFLDWSICGHIGWGRNSPSYFCC